jgi:hypothetical protein
MRDATLVSMVGVGTFMKVDMTSLFDIRPGMQGPLLEHPFGSGLGLCKSHKSFDWLFSLIASPVDVV